MAVFIDQEFGTGQAVADVLNVDPDLIAFEVSRPQVEHGQLRRFDCVIARIYGPPESDLPTAATIDALQDFIDSGHGYIGEWWGAGAALAEEAPSIDGPYDVPARFLGFFSGGASDGDEVQFDNPITVVQDHPVVEGLPEVFSGQGGTEFFVRAAMPYVPSLLVLATYEGHGATNPAIMVGPLGSSASGTSNAVLLFFDARDDPGQPSLSILWRNAAHWACAHQPETTGEDGE